MGLRPGTLEGVVNPMFGGFYDGKVAAITGHTGFKGSWLAFWLAELGARVHGYSLPPPTHPNLHEVLSPGSITRQSTADIRDLPGMTRWLDETQPDIVFHLAAQPLVRLSYQDPLDTLTSCVLGTAHVLEAIRTLGLPTRVVIVTTDKVYENHSWPYGYRETDALGGHDPYSASKAAAEIITHAWRRSFFPAGRVTTVRAGNVIGGGDYAVDRIVPDAVRSRLESRPLQLRHPHATRPWQHVLDCLSGYLEVGARLDGSPFPEAFNFGPGPDGNRSVAELIDAFGRHWPGAWEQVGREAHLVEANLLNLAIDRACTHLGWHPVWPFARAVQETADWYAARHLTAESDMVDYSRSQLQRYTTDARRQGLRWATRTP